MKTGRNEPCPCGSGSRTKEWLATGGGDVFSRRRRAQMYRDVFTYAVDIQDWKAWIPDNVQHEHFDIVREAALFLFYLLHKHPEGTVGEFMDRVTRAFPEFVRPAQDHPASLEFLVTVVSELFFARFCTLFGLVGVTGDPSSFPEARSAEYRVTPLFTGLFQWKV